MGVDDLCESGGDSMIESLAALAFAQLQLDTVTVDIRVQSDRERYGGPSDASPLPPPPPWCTPEAPPSDDSDPQVIALTLLGHKAWRSRGKMVLIPMSLAKKYQRMGVIRPMSDEEMEAHAKAEMGDPAPESETPDISRGLTTAARIHNVRSADPDSVAC
jgi:hypothetical protein